MSAAAEPEVVVQVPAKLHAWQRTPINIIVHNQTSLVIQPVRLKLESDLGTIETWGVDGPVVRWGATAPARRRNNRWELWVEPTPQQPTGPRAKDFEQATERLVRLAPIAVGARAEVGLVVDAAYQHGGRLDAVLTYISIDPKRRPLCTVGAQPTGAGFVPCVPVSTLGVEPIYLPYEELARDMRTARGRTHFVVEAPDFDLGDARARVQVPDGPFAYAPREASWVLYDHARDITWIVGAIGPPEQLAGDWIAIAVALDRDGSVTLFWDARSADDAQLALERLQKAGISASPFTRKGHTAADRLIVTLTRAGRAKLDSIVQGLGYRVSERTVD